MGSLEEKVSYIEAKVEEQGKLEQRLEHRFDLIDQRFVQVDQRFAQVDERFAELRSLITALDQKSDRRFIWLVGMQFTTLIAIIAGMLTIFTKAV